MIFGTQLCKWILIILVNLLHCMSCTSLTWWRNIDVTEIMPFTVHVTLSPCCRERCQILSLHTEMWPHNSPDLDTASGVYFKRGSTVHRYMMWRSWKNVCWWSGGCWTTPSSRQRLRSYLNACVRVNGGHFEHKLWASDFPLSFVCFIDTGFRKYDRYKHVQRANIVWNVLLFCLTLSHGMVAP